MSSFALSFPLFLSHNGPTSISEAELFTQTFCKYSTPDNSGHAFPSHPLKLKIFKNRMSALQSVLICFSFVALSLDSHWTFSCLAIYDFLVSYQSEKNTLNSLSYHLSFIHCYTTFSDAFHYYAPVFPPKFQCLLLHPLIWVSSTLSTTFVP